MRRRSGFTIVELLVAMALIMFIMAILSEAFVAGLKSFRDLKASADMAERLRSVSTLLRRELAADHFDGRRKLSQPDFWYSEEYGVISPPREGFFRIYQGSALSTVAGSPYLFEGSDAIETLPTPIRDNRLMNPYRATDHMLHFTVKLRGNERGDFFSAGNIPAAGAALTTSPLLQGGIHYQEGTTVFNSEWAEVAYFLRKLPEDAHGTPLYALYRRQKLLVTDNALLTNNALTWTPITGTTNNYLEMSCSQDFNTPANLYFYNPRDITMPIHRMGMDPGNLAGTFAVGKSYRTMGDENATYEGADLLLTDVVSFEVRVLPIINGTVETRFMSLFDNKLSTAALNGNNSVYGAGVVPAVAGPRVFDTWSNYKESSGNKYDYSSWTTTGTTTSIPFSTNVRLAAIQVIIRVWDVKTDQTRQITIAQDL